MGRRKIEIQPITHDRNRSVTFLKRKNGLFKKAYELGVLCSVDVCVIVFAHNGKLHEYCSGDSNAILERRFKYNGDRDLRRPSDFNNSKNTAADKGDSSAEDDGESPGDGAGKGKAGSSSNLQPQGPGIELPSLASTFSLPAPTGGSNYERRDSMSNHPSSLPPAAHPLSIGGLPPPNYVSPTTQTGPSIASHHHQLAQQFLVTQLQNINPNLNVYPPPTNVPPRGGSILPFGTGPGAAPGPRPTDNAFGNAFLNSLLGTANAAAAAAANANEQFGGHHTGPGSGAFADSPWPIPSSRGVAPASTSNSSIAAPPRNDTETPSTVSSAGSPPLRQASVSATQPSQSIDSTWLEMLLGTNSTALPTTGPAHNNETPKLDSNKHLHPSWHNPGGPGSRAATPLDGVPLSAGAPAAGSSSSSSEKRPRSGSAGTTGTGSEDKMDEGDEDDEDGKKRQKR